MNPNQLRCFFLSISCCCWLNSHAFCSWCVSRTIISTTDHYSLSRFVSVQHHEEESNACPYSMRFAPHRIDLTRLKQIPPSYNLWWSSLIPMRRQRFERTVKCDRLEWYEDIKGEERSLSLLIVLFQQVAASMISNKEEETIVVLAFPNAPPTLLHHAVEIITPYAPLWTIQLQWEPLPHIRLIRNINFTVTNSNKTAAAWIDEATHIQRTRSWVQRLLVTHGICPYTRTDTASGHGVAGVPVAAIAYRATPASTLLQLVVAALESIQHDMLDAGPARTSSILLAAPAFDDLLKEWTGPFFAILQACIVAAALEDTVGVVCFHPQYKVPDGQTWPGFGQMHSVPRLQQLTHIASWKDAAAGGAWQRRTPHATLNVLWAPQLAAAEQQRNTTTLYRVNIQKLVNTIGVEQLQTDLERERNLFL